MELRKVVIWPFLSREGQTDLHSFALGQALDECADYKPEPFLESLIISPQ